MPPVPTSVRRVALLVETTRSYTRDLLAGVNRYLLEHNRKWSTFLELRAFESSIPPWLKAWDGDGILCRTHGRSMARAVAGTGLPTVELRSTNYNRHFPFVGMDNALIGASVAEHFLNRGYRNFAAYTLDSEAFFRERIRNFVRAIEESGATCELLPAQSEESPRDWEEHQASLMDWLGSLPKPIAIFATNDQLGVRLLDACRRSGIPVPEEVAVVGCENERTLCECSSPALTSVQFDGRTVGYRAAEILDRLMEGGEAPTKPVLVPPLGIEVRGSSDEFVIEDPVAHRAMVLIRGEALSGITVAQLCESLSVSRSTLERRMKKALGRSAKEEVLRVRFREVNRLLLNTDLTIETISGMTGFSHAHYLQTTYRERFGIPPGKYRRQHADR